jgi:hypothetical protein
MTIGKIRSLLYLLGRILGDLSAIGRGSDAVAKRLARRAAGRVTGRMLGKLFR